jgi:hypothetical protein
VRHPSGDADDFHLASAASMIALIGAEDVGNAPHDENTEPHNPLYAVRWLLP